MQVTIQFEAQLREAAGANHIEIPIAVDATLLQVLQALAASTDDALADRILKPDGTIQAGLMIFINDVPVSGLAAPSRSLSEGDTVLLLPPISGG